MSLVTIHQIWVKYIIALYSCNFRRLTELVWHIGTDKILIKTADAAFWASGLAELHQAR